MTPQETSIQNSAELSTTFLRNELSTAFLRIWETSLGLPLEPADVAIADKSSLPWLGAVAWIGGSWTGNVRIGFSKELAFKVAVKLLDTTTPSIPQVADALRELANMTAGNLKSVLPGKCGLATPGNFEIRSLDAIQDEFSPILLNWYQSENLLMFISLSALDS